MPSSRGGPRRYAAAAKPDKTFKEAADAAEYAELRARSRRRTGRASTWRGDWTWWKSITAMAAAAVAAMSALERREGTGSELKSELQDGPIVDAISGWIEVRATRIDDWQQPYRRAAAGRIPRRWIGQRAGAVVWPDGQKPDGDYGGDQISAARGATRTAMDTQLTRTDDVVDVLRGVAVPDPYRWLEDGGAPETRAWVDAQNADTRAVLDGLPHRPLRARLNELSRHGLVGNPDVRGARAAYQRRDGQADQPMLLLRDLGCARADAGRSECAQAKAALSPRLVVSIRWRRLLARQVGRRHQLTRCACWTSSARRSARRRDPLHAVCESGLARRTQWLLLHGIRRRCRGTCSGWRGAVQPPRLLPFAW